MGFAFEKFCIWNLVFSRVLLSSTWGFYLWDINTLVTFKHLEVSIFQSLFRNLEIRAFAKTIKQFDIKALFWNI